MNSLCNRMNEVNILWSLYFGMMASFVGIEGIILMAFLAADCSQRKRTKNPCKLHINLPAHKGACKSNTAVTCYFFMSAAVFVAVGMFLIADNRHLLDCYKIKRSKDEDESELRLASFVVAFAIFTTVNIGFFSQKSMLLCSSER